jgi:hypothetical protein
MSLRHTTNTCPTLGAGDENVFRRSAVSRQRSMLYPKNMGQHRTGGSADALQ